MHRLLRDSVCNVNLLPFRRVSLIVLLLCVVKKRAKHVQAQRRLALPLPRLSRALAARQAPARPWWRPVTRPALLVLWMPPLRAATWRPARLVRCDFATRLRARENVISTNLGLAWNSLQCCVQQLCHDCCQIHIASACQSSGLNYAS